MELFAIVWIVVGAIMVAVAGVTLLTRGFGPGSTTIIVTMGCIGAPFVIFGIWGLHAELKPYKDVPKNKQQ